MNIGPWLEYACAVKRVFSPRSPLLLGHEVAEGVALEFSLPLVRPLLRA